MPIHRRHLLALASAAAESIAPPALANILANLNANNGLVRSAIPNRYAFGEGVTGYSIGDGGNDTLEVTNTVAPSYLVGGSGDDVLIHDGGGHIKADGGDDFDDCLVRGGDEVVNCEY